MNPIGALPTWLVLVPIGTLLAVEVLAAWGQRARRRQLRRWLKQRQPRT